MLVLKITVLQNKFQLQRILKKNIYENKFNNDFLRIIIARVYKNIFSQSPLLQIALKPFHFSYLIYVANYYHHYYY